MTRDRLIMCAALSAAVAIAAGAFGAHGVSGKAADWLHTGGLYQLIHAVAVIAVIRHRRVGWLLLAGSALFAFTLYAMALGAPLWFGAITPIGGLMMISGWLLLAYEAGRPSRSD
jgi:uncharacterized membrane protein YgdD (TMEM256/DUF423 family)